MLKNLIVIFLIVFGLATLWVSTSTTTMEYLSYNRRGDAWWNTNSWKHGNLVGMAYLDFVGQFHTPKDVAHKSYARRRGDEKAVLYLFGDSYSWPLRDSDFANIASFHFTNRYQGGKYTLDTAMKNILVIEVAERLVLDYFSSVKMKDEFSANKESKEVITGLTKNTEMTVCSLVSIADISKLFNKRINQNLEYNLFNYNFLSVIFKLKAIFNYYLFNRASGDVVISEDRKYLFDKGSVSLSSSSGSYTPIAQETINDVVNNLNFLYNYYKKEGFNEVYYSIIPSTPSIVQPKGYNQLIPRIQNNPGLKVKVLDIYKVLSEQGQDYFCHGDTHWNYRGEQKWLDLVNEQLMKVR